jgi:putative flavoprotein involved in K+ transport
VSTVVIGAGQAGLAVSRGLTGFGVEHVVLEQALVAQAWRDRWDSFTLVTPNWTLDLPGSPYSGGDPEGHVARDEIVSYLQAYAAGAPIREGVRVDALGAGPAAGFRLRTSDGEVDASTVVVCTGAYQRPFRPAAVGGFPPGVLVMDANDYRNPDALPDGQVLVVGSGQTGCQLAEELHLAARDVFLACGRAPWAPRRLNGTDTITWLTRAGFYDQTLAELPSPAARLAANVQTTGGGGGHDLHYRTLQSLGVPLLGRLAGVDSDRASFTDDLGASVAFGDARWADLCQLIKTQLPARLPGAGAR